jgi:hypothetical protein
MGAGVLVVVVRMLVGYTPPVGLLLMGVVLFTAVGGIITAVLGWLFDELTEYKIQIIAEGTARALGELE